MLHSFDQLRGYAIHASDGEIGSLRDVYFDDQSTLIRYFVVDTGTWLPGNRVLLVPAVVGGVDVERGEIVTGLTRQQVEDSPPVDTEQPVFRQQELSLHTYYGWEPYWTVPPLAGSLAPYWGAAVPAGTHVRPGEERVAEEAAAREREERDPHLRSAREVEGYHVAASDGEIGHVEDFFIDDRDWAIQLLGIDTRNWLPGRKVVISPGWLRGIDWAGRRIEVDLTRQQIKDSPGYDPTLVPEESYLERLAAYYGQPWR
jgi:sporulation protein YlmC with PRC-barrel domain